MTKLESEVARKSSRIPICKCNQLHTQIDLCDWVSMCMCGHVCVQSHVLNDKGCDYLVVIDSQ